MPLIIIALIFLIGLLIYVIVGYKTSEHDGPLVKDRFPDKFKRKESANFTVEEVDNDDDDDNIIFPTDNIELEKHKRNIH